MNEALRQKDAEIQKRDQLIELYLIASKLDETAKTEAALIRTAMNATYRLTRWLLHLFADDPLLRFIILQTQI